MPACGNLMSGVLFPARLNCLAKHLTPNLSLHKTVLDVGASDGRLASRLSKHVSAAFTCCDVYPQGQQFVPVVKYDGRRLPFDDNSFDCVMLIDVLHHDVEPQEVVREAARVSRNRALIKDHFFFNGLDFFGLKVMDYIGNAPYGIPLPYNFLKEAQWYQLAKDLDLTVKEDCRFRYNILDPCRHIVLDLAKASAG